MILLAGAATGLAASPARAADADLDPGFGTGGVARTDIAGADDVLADLVVQGDGRIIAAGTQPDFPSVLTLARYKTDGTLDGTFGTGGKATERSMTGTDETVQAVGIQSTSRIIVAGSESIGGRRHVLVARFTAAGLIDPLFGVGGFTLIDAAALELGQPGSSFVFGMAIQKDDKIVLAGAVSLPGGTEDFLVIRLTKDGAPDNTFGQNGLVTRNIVGGGDRARAVAIQADGAIVVAGYANMGPGSVNRDFAVIRLLGVDGKLDSSFGGGDGVATLSVGTISGRPEGSDDECNAVALLPGGRMALAGKTNALRLQSQNDFAVAVIDSAGTPDPLFGTNGVVITDIRGGNDRARRVVSLGDGRLLVGGDAEKAPGSGDVDLALVRYTPTGAPDATWGAGGILLQDGGNALADRGVALRVQSDGRVLAGMDPGRPAGSTDDFVVFRYKGAPPDMLAPKILSAVSRRTHGNAGGGSPQDFDIDLNPLSAPGSAGVECREGGPQKIVITFSEPIDPAGTASLSAGTGVVNIAGHQMTISNIAGVPNGSCLRVRLLSVTDPAGNPLAGANTVYVRVLRGDVNGDGLVASADITQIKSRSGQTADAGNFRFDVTVDGLIASADITQVKSRSGDSVECR